MEYNTDEVNELIEELYKIRNNKRCLTIKEGECKQALTKIMKTHNITKIVGENLTCKLNECKRKSISKDIPPELIEPWYVFKTYKTLTISQKGAPAPLQHPGDMDS